MYNKNNPNYRLYLAGIITESQYYDILEKNQESKKIPLRENESIALVPKNELEKHYLDVVKKRFKPSNANSLLMRLAFEPDNLWKQIYDSIYGSIRTAPEDHYKSVPHDSDIDYYTSEGNNMIQVKNSNNWHYRMPKSFSGHPRAAYEVPKEEQERISLAAIADKRLIDALDDYVANKRLAYYKTPHDSAKWKDRHDPITIYFNEKITPEVKEELKDIFNNKDFNRSLHVENPLEGDEFSKGLAREENPRQKKIEKLIGEIKSLNMDAYKLLYKEWGGPKFKVSSGMFLAGEEVKKLCEKHLDKIPVTDQSKSEKLHLSDIAKSMFDQKWQELYNYWQKTSDQKQKTQIGTDLIKSAIDNHRNPMANFANYRHPDLEKYVTLFDLGKNVKDQKWQRLYGHFLKSKDETLKNALKQAALTKDMSHIQGYTVVSPSDYSHLVKDNPKWHQLLSGYSSSKDETLGKALIQSAQTGDMKYIQGY